MHAITSAFTAAAQAACLDAVRRAGFHEVHVSHLLAALLDQQDTAACWILEQAAIDPQEWHTQLEKPALHNLLEAHETPYALRFSSDIDRVLCELLVKQAEQRLGGTGALRAGRKVTTFHLLDALCGSCWQQLPPDPESLKGAPWIVVRTKINAFLRTPNAQGMLERELAAPAGLMHEPGPFRPFAVVDHLNQKVVGQEEAKKALALAAYDHVERLSERAGPVLLAGPTGCGKTYLIDQVARWLNLPFVVVDCSNLTAAGYWGDNMEDGLQNLYFKANNNVQRAARGIVFFDEVDKLAVVAAGNSNLPGYRREVQVNLLRFMEGHTYNVRATSDRYAATFPFPTHDLLVLCGGAFPDLQQIVERRTQGPGTRMGFGDGAAGEAPDKSFLQPLPEDLIEYGLIAEFVGRLSCIACLDPLGKAEMITLLGTMEGSPGRQARAWFAQHKVTLDFMPAALDALAERACAWGTGARGLRAVLNTTLQEAKYNVANQPGITRVQVTPESVLDTEVQPRLLSEAAAACARPTLDLSAAPDIPF